MTKVERMNQLKVRIHLLEGRGDKNIKSSGVLRKLKREYYKLSISMLNELIH